jgi:hypothetical protein
MRIHVGCELHFEFPQTTPMIATLNVHFSRAPELERPDYLMTSPSVPIEGIKSSYPNWLLRGSCTKRLSPKRFSTRPTQSSRAHSKAVDASAQTASLNLALSPPQVGLILNGMAQGFFKRRRSFARRPAGRVGEVGSAVASFSIKILGGTGHLS